MDSSRVSAREGRGEKRRAKKRANPRSWLRMARPRERGIDKFCLADTVLTDDHITPARQASPHHQPPVTYPFEDHSTDLSKISKNNPGPTKQFTAARVHLSSQVHWEISVLKDDNNESDCYSF